MVLWYYMARPVYCQGMRRAVEMKEMTTAEAAALLGCSQAHVGHLVKTGALRGRALTPRMYLVERASVERYARKTPTRGWKRGRPRKPAPGEDSPTGKSAE